MKRISIGSVLLVMVAVYPLFLAPVQGAGGLSHEGKQVVDYLLADWGKQFRSSSIPLAMSNLGMEPNDALRLEIGEFFRDNTQLANNLKWWGANNYILSNEEKLIAKYLINTFDDKDRMPGGKKLAKAVGISQKMLKGRLAFLVKAGLLEESGDGALGYQLADGYKRWGGPLRHSFHIVNVEGEKPFDVWWAVDFLLLVNSEYQNKTLHIEDSCSHCSERISVTVDKTKITALDPESVWVQQGGGWTVDNLFWSEEHLNDWLSENRAYKRLDQMPIGDFLAKVMSGELD